MRNRPVTADSHLTTGQVAKLLRISSRTVACWVDDGRLPGYLLPPRRSGQSERDRRVLGRDLAAFCRANGMPVPAELADPGDARTAVFEEWVIRIMKLEREVERLTAELDRRQVLK